MKTPNIVKLVVLDRDPNKMKTPNIVKLVVFAFFTTLTVQGTSNVTTNADRRIVKQATVPTNPRPAVDSVTVSQNGRYKTIAQALGELKNRVPGRRFVVNIEAGIFKENLRIESHPNVTFVGAGIGKTVITSDKIHGSNTWEAATVLVGEGFFARNLTIQNTATTQQAPAVVTKGRAAFWHVELDGYQDTIYASLGTQFFSECEITGSVDTISADVHANVIIENSKIYVKPPVRRGVRQIYISASNRHPTTPSTGIIVFHKNTISSKVHLGTDIEVFLGRPWGPAAKTVYINNHFNVSVQSALGSPMTPGSRFEYFGEFGNSGSYSTGPGRKQMNYGEASQYTVGRFIPAGEKWLRDTLHVPFITVV